MFVFECKGYLGYLPKNDQLICKGIEIIAAKSFSDAVKICNEKDNCKAVHHWTTSPEIFHICTGTKQRDATVGVAYVKGYEGYQKLGENVWCYDLHSGSKEFDNVPTAIKDCIKNDQCVGVKDIDNNGKKIIQCENFNNNTAHSTKGDTYRKKKCVHVKITFILKKHV